MKGDRETSQLKTDSLQHLFCEFQGRNASSHLIDNPGNEIGPPEPIKKLVAAAHIQDQHTMRTKDAVAGGEHSFYVGEVFGGHGIIQMVNDLVTHDSIKELVRIGKIKKAAVVKVDR